MQRILLLFLVQWIGMGLYSQSLADKYLDLTRKGFQEKNALSTTAYVESRWRVPGNKGFDESIYYVEKILKNAGFVLQKSAEDEGPLTYRLESRALKQPTWEPVDAGVTIDGEAEPFIRFSTNRNMIPINCPSTPSGGVSAEVIYFPADSLKTISQKDLKGKIVFSETYAGAFMSAAVKAGAIGVLSYSMPAYTQPEKYTNSIQFSSMRSQGKEWSLLLSFAAKEKLKASCIRGKTVLKVFISTKSYEAPELTLVANVRGLAAPGQRLVYSAHVQEPGANDNATGVGTLAEMARLTAELVKSGRVSPQRTLTFLWGTEISATARYIKEDTARAKGIVWGMSLDMVGEDTKKTGGTFLIEKMPDPSALWTRGEDRHTEWGAGQVTEKDLFPHYYNDLILSICKKQGAYAGWVVNTNPFEGGSDHTPFLQNKIPGLLLWHFTDVFYHTDNDRLDKVSAETMKNVGVSALSTGLFLTTADETAALELVKIVKAAADKRMAAETALSKQAIADGKPVGSEKRILASWSGWYSGALTSIGELPVKKGSTRLGSALKVAVLDLEKKSAAMIDGLK
ncbi:MAG: M28 family peptidase [Chitinophagaceae bacterium]|nr:MAG: M28 family peptidase [Chitinophagaceae bacterium]